MSVKAIVAALCLGLGLSACTTMGTNVSGKFRCEAADGVCAPSMVIDDSALARIEETGSADLLNPAGPFRMDDGIDAPVHAPQPVAALEVARVAPSYALVVVFPGYTDVSGTAHPRRTVRTQAALPGRGDALDAMALRGSKIARGQGLLAAAESAPPFLAIVPAAVEADARPTIVSSSSEAAAAQDLPSALASAPQQALPAAPHPIAAIEAEVAQRLAAQPPAPRREAPSFPATPE